jgi:two-component system sensor histidine kinase ChiS
MSGPLILIVEDEISNVELFTMLLDFEGFRTQAVLDVKRALDAIQEERPDLILLDIMLPEASGLELCTTLKNDPRYDSIPIVIVSAKTQLEDVERGMQAGAASYLLKPVAKEELLTAVKDAMA